MTPEQMQKIVDDAPEWADTYLFNGIYADSKIVNCGAIGILLDSIRTELAKHDTLDLEPADIPHGCIVLEK